MQTQLFPDPEQASKLAATIKAFNAAADWLVGEAFALRSANKVKLQQLFYPTLRERFGLSSQMAIRCIAEVCGAYRRDKSKRPGFREIAAVPYDQRLMSFKGVDRVSLLTLEGRVIVPLVMGEYQRERLSEKYGQCDLVRRRDGKWFLLVTVEVAEKSPAPRADFLGVDFGLYNLATDSDGEFHTDAEVEHAPSLPEGAPQSATQGGHREARRQAPEIGPAQTEGSLGPREALQKEYQPQDSQAHR